MRVILEICAAAVAIIVTFMVFFLFVWVLQTMFGEEPTPKPEPDGSVHICVNAQGEITEGEDWRECMTVDYFRR